jgi:nucleotide-binding universal stress UspA family protein
MLKWVATVALAYAVVGWRASAGMTCVTRSEVTAMSEQWAGANDSRPVVVGVDGSPGSLRALDWAADEAALRHLTLRVVHAFAWPMLDLPLDAVTLSGVERELRDNAKRVLDAAVTRVQHRTPGLPVVADAAEIDPAPALINASGAAAMLVLGHRGHGGFTELRLGSVSGHVAAHAGCPVIVLRGRQRPTQPAALPGPVVVGVDDSEPSRAALAFAMEEASLRGLPLAVIHAWRRPVTAETAPAGYDMENLARREARMVARMVATVREDFRDVRIEERILPGSATATLVDASRTSALVVVGARGRGGLTGLLLGSTSQQLLHHADCPVAVIRSAAAQARSGR